MSDLQRTALYHTHAALGAKLVPFAGWEMPLRYSGDKDEVTAVRTAAGLFDVSHMGQVELRGANALRDVNHFITNDLARAESGQATYTMVCNERGGVIDDLIVYRLADDHLFIVVNASRAEVDIAWMREQLSPDTTLETFTPQRGIIALQGPRADEVLQPLCDADLAPLRRHFSMTAKVCGVECRFARTGYTGENGFELFPPGEKLNEVWSSLISHPSSLVKPCGLGARDVCRLEAGLRLYGNDLSEDITPLEAGLKWTVKFDKDDFIGKTALQQQLAAGPPRKTIGLRMLDRAIPRHEYRVVANGVDAGVVTSGIFSPTLNVGIAMALVRGDVADDADYGVVVRGEPHPAEVVRMPFVKK